MMITHLGGGTAPCFQAVRECHQFGGAGLNIPSWRELVESPCRPAEVWVAAKGHSEVGAAVHARGGGLVWEIPRRACINLSTRSFGLSSTDSNAHVSGHTRNHAVSCCVADSTFSPLRTCRCGLPLDKFGHHRAVCADGCWGRGGFLWSALQRRFAGRLGPMLSQTCSSGTWISPSGGVHNWQWLCRDGSARCRSP